MSDLAASVSGEVREKIMGPQVGRVRHPPSKQNPVLKDRGGVYPPPSVLAGVSQTVLTMAAVLCDGCETRQ